MQEDLSFVLNLIEYVLTYFEIIENSKLSKFLIGLFSAQFLEEDTVFVTERGSYYYNHEEKQLISYINSQGIVYIVRP